MRGAPAGSEAHRDSEAKARVGNQAQAESLSRKNPNPKTSFTMAVIGDAEAGRFAWERVFSPGKGAYEKLMSAGFELWSQVMPERAMACCFNLEYLLVGGRDGRREERPYFMWYDWMAGGWGGRQGRDVRPDAFQPHPAGGEPGGDGAIGPPARTSDTGGNRGGGGAGGV